MTTQIIPLFSTPLYISNIKITEEIVNYTKQLKFIPSSADMKIQDCFMSDSNNILDDIKYIDLKKDIEEHLNFFLKSQLGISKKINFKITKSWVVKHLKGQYAPAHIHRNSFFSGVVYLQVSGTSGNISFTKQTSSIYPQQIFLEIDDYNIYNSLCCTLTPKNGNIIIFPSDVSHNVSLNNSDIDRLVLAFNVFVTGTLNTDTTVELKL